MANKKDYTEDELSTALSRVTSPPTYAGTYDQKLRDMYDEIQNRKPFSYDLGSDAMYQQYKDKYTQLGQKAMKDTIGQGAALTGGYDNSYAQSAGQQAYNGYLDRLNDIVPDLQEAAYGRYRDEGNDLLQQYSMLGDLANDEYGKYRDSLSDYRYEDETAYGRERDAVADQRYADETAYSRSRDALADQRYADELAYERQQKAYATLAALIQASGYSPTDQELADAGMSQEQARAMKGQWISENILPDSGSASGGYTSGGGYSSGGGASGGSGFVPASSAPAWWNSMSMSERMALQSSLGISADGIWGAQTKAATEAAGYKGGSGTDANYSEIQGLASDMYNSGSSSEDIKSMLADAYLSGIISDTYYNRLIQKYR